VTEIYLSADAWVVIHDGPGPRQRQHATVLSSDSKGNRVYTFPCGMGTRERVAVFNRNLIEGRQVCGQAWCQKRYADHHNHKDEIERRIAEDEAEVAEAMRAVRSRLKKLERRLVRA
jgi:hypothetical protein